MRKRHHDEAPVLPEAGDTLPIVKLRRDVLLLDKTCDSYRLVHSEGDGLSGPVADKYGPCIVLQLYSAGMHRHLQWVRQGFAEQYPDAELIVRSDYRTEKLEGVK